MWRQRAGWSALIWFVILGCITEASIGPEQNTSSESEAPFPDGSNAEQWMGNALVAGEFWVRTAFNNGLFGHQHSEENCPGIPYREEYGGVEISTGRCEQITLIQPSLSTVNEGEKLRLIAWHSQLISDEPTRQTGAIMVAVRDHVIWSEQSPIPGGARSFDLTFESEIDIRRGDPIRLHVHNHGANAWTLLSIEKAE